jgi:hypothetical protein
MSTKLKLATVAAAATITLATFVAAGPPVQASTTACGSSCANPTNQLLGTDETPTISIALKSGQKGTCPALTAAGLQEMVSSPPSTCTLTISMATETTTNPGQDWEVINEGTVAAFIQGGALSTALGIQYATNAGTDLPNEVVEFEATPDGAPSGACMAATGNTTSIALTQCGAVTSAGTVTNGSSVLGDSDGSSISTSSTNPDIYSASAWILDGSNATGGYDDIISGSNQGYSSPGVLTASSSGVLSDQILDESNGTVTSSQMWGFEYGPQSTDAIKHDGMKHT